MKSGIIAENLKCDTGYRTFFLAFQHITFFYIKNTMNKKKNNKKHSA